MMISIQAKDHADKLLGTDAHLSAEEMVGAIAKASKMCLIVVDFDAKEILYQSSTLLYLREIPTIDKAGNCKHPYWGVVPKNMRRQLTSLQKYYFHEAHRLMANGVLHTCVTDFPIKIGKEVMFINQKFRPVVLDGAGRIKLGVIVLTPSVATEIQSYIISDDGKRMKYDFESACFKGCKSPQTLSTKQEMVLSRAKLGMNAQEIAGRLNMGVYTVRDYLKHVYEKLGTKSLAQALIKLENIHLE